MVRRCHPLRTKANDLTSRCCVRTTIPQKTILRVTAASLVLVLASLHQLPLRAEPQRAAEPAKPAAPVKTSSPTANEICRVVSQAASDNGLPLDFFTRLIWQESRFNPEAISPKGAQGIAQFMPGTASGRGLAESL